MLNSSSVELFVENMKQRIAKQYMLVVRNKETVEEASWIEECYFLLKRIRDGCAVFQMKDPFHIAHFLLKRIRSQGIAYKLYSEDVDMVLEGLRQLLDYFNAYSDRKIETSLRQSRKTQLQTKQTILIVDNDTPFVDWLSERFVESNFRLTAVDIENVLETLSTTPPAMLIINMMLPNRAAFQLIHQLNQNRALFPFPILALTHSIEERHVHEILQSGVDEVIHKPFAFSLFVYKIKSLLKQHSYVEYSLQKRHEETKEILQKEWDRFQRFHSYFSLLYIKLESGLNDKENLSRDIARFSKVVSHSLRAYDEIGIWSHNAMIILLPATRLKGAVLVGERIKRLWNESDNHVCRIIIAAIESDHAYEHVIKMVERLEKETKMILSSDGIREILFPKHSVHEKEGKGRLLLIDDDPVPASILSNYLKEEEWEFEVCADGRYALEKVLEFQPHFIVCETKMAHLDGYLFCSQIRNIPCPNQPVFIFLSKQSLTHHVVRGFQVGADDYIAKPFSVRELEARLKRFRKRLLTAHTGEGK